MLERLGKGVLTSEGNDNVASSCLNSGENVLGGVPNYFLLYNSMFNGFFEELTTGA